MQWNADSKVYRCGAVTQPEATLQRSLPTLMQPVAALLAPVLAVVAKRAIATDVGCDSSLDAGYPPTDLR